MGEQSDIPDEWLGVQQVAEPEEAEIASAIEQAEGRPEGDGGSERSWGGWARTVGIWVPGRRRRVVTVVQWHAAARARMVIALGWTMHDRMARVSDWGVT